VNAKASLRQRRRLAQKLARLVDQALVPCGAAGSGIGERCRAHSRAARAALGEGRRVVVEVEHRGITPAGELRHPVIKGWNVEE
jgi:bifunctional non-homologous end joining protein LigD